MIKQAVTVGFCIVILGVFEMMADEQPGVGPPPSWVTRFQIDTTGSAATATGDLYYLLVEAQENIAREEYFARVASKILNTEGVQSGSDISVSYDPAYQSLRFCSVIVHRNGKQLDRLNPQAIQIYRRATSAEMHTYDKSVEATIHLPDVRAGDIVEHSFVISGYLPTYRGRYFDWYTLNYSEAVGRRILRILKPADRFLATRTQNNPPDPRVQTIDGLTEYLWDVHNPQAVTYDDNVPSWYDPFQMVFFSEFSTWGEVARWAAPLYAISKDEQARVSEEHPQLVGSDRHRSILETIRFVQDEIRYVSVLSGLSAHRPSPPSTVLERRYGDCKDKSLLLVSLLQAQGIRARPVLVNVNLCSFIADRLPSPGAFNHCVVTLFVDGRQVFVDPTLRNQGGPLDSVFFPTYGRGLIVDSVTTELATLPLTFENSVSVTEHFISQDFGGPTSFAVRTVYGGQSADEVRTHYKTSTIEDIQKSYTDFYKRLYPAIVSTDKPKVVEDERWTGNRIVVEETYSIPDFWKTADSSSPILSCELRPLVLDQFLHTPDAGSRTAPFALGQPISIRVLSDIDLPREWSARLKPKEFSTKASSYRYQGTHSGNHISVVHEFERREEQVAAGDFTDFVTTHEKIRNHLSLQLTWNPTAKEFSLSWVSVLVAIIAAGAGGYFGRRMYLEYDPPARAAVSPVPKIGGWLILLAINVTLSPFLLVYRIVVAEASFNGNILAAADGWTRQLVVEAELALNVMLLMASILTALMLYKRRTSFPRVFTIYLISSLIFQVADLVAFTTLFDGDLAADPDSISGVTQLAVYAGIWIPYVWISERSRKTFTLRRITGPEVAAVASPSGEKEQLLF